MSVNLSQANLGWTLAQLTAKRLMRRRSTWFFLILGMLPSSIFLFWIIAKATGNFATTTKPYGIFLGIQSLYLLSFYVPLLAIFLGLGVVSDEIETKNITFTLVRPLNRLSIVWGRFLGHLMVAIATVLISIFVIYMSNMLFQVEDIVRKLPNLINGMFVLSIGIVAYLSVVALLGTLLKRFAIIICIFWILIDAFFSMLPVDSLQAISIKHRMLSSYGEALPQFNMSFTEITPGSLIANAVVCLLFAAISCFLMWWRFNAKEIVLSDSAN